MTALARPLGWAVEALGVLALGRVEVRTVTPCAGCATTTRTRYSYAGVVACSRSCAARARREARR